MLRTVLHIFVSYFDMEDLFAILKEKVYFWSSILLGLSPHTQIVMNYRESLEFFCRNYSCNAIFNTPVSLAPNFSTCNMFGGSPDLRRTKVNTLDLSSCSLSQITQRINK